jgi:curved DNA-binding protein CbpA
MDFQIQRGLFTGDFMDYYAILGVPVDIDPKDIRKGYLQIARRLHPDSSSLTTDADRQAASQLLSKWVNPAWENLAQEKGRTEYNLLLKMKGQAAGGGDSLHLNSVAQQLLTASNPDFFYRSALGELTKKQFENLAETTEVTARISELNLAYLIRKQSSGENTISSTRPLYTVGASFSETPPEQQPQANRQPTERESLAEAYFRRAEAHYKKGDQVQAIRELRDGLAIDAKHSRSHSLLGMAYMSQKQATMAKIHFNKALEIDPNDEQAIIGKQVIERTTPSAAPAPAKSGLFGGLFGRKK